jgi:hypothetical protein
LTQEWNFGKSGDYGEVNEDVELQDVGIEQRWWFGDQGEGSLGSIEAVDGI